MQLEPAEEPQELDLFRVVGGRPQLEDTDLLEELVPLLLPLLLHLGHPVVRFVGRACDRSPLAPRGGVAAPARCRVRGGDEGRVRLSQLLQLCALCRELLAEL